MGKYTLEVSEKQLKIINDALENYFRTRYKQFIDLADDLAFANYDRAKEGDAGFKARINRRNEAKELLDKAGEAALPWYDDAAKTKTEECMIAEDIWAVIRHELWKEDGAKNRMSDVRSYPPILISGEDPVKLKGIE